MLASAHENPESIRKNRPQSTWQKFVMWLQYFESDSLLPLNIVSLYTQVREQSDPLGF